MESNIFPCKNTIFVAPPVENPLFELNEVHRMDPAKPTSQSDIRSESIFIVKLTEQITKRQQEPEFGTSQKMKEHIRRNFHYLYIT